MAKKVTPITGGNLAYQQMMKEEAGLIERFFKQLQELRKSIVIKYRPPTGQFSGRADDYHLPTKEPEVIYHNGAWTGFTLNGVFYRTESIKCRNAFIAWIKELLTDAKKLLWNAATFEPPKGVFFYSP